MVDGEDEGDPVFELPATLEAPGGLTLEGLIIFFHGGKFWRRRQKKDLRQIRG